MADVFRSHRFDPERHDVELFTCREESLDRVLRGQAAPAAARGTAHTWVWLDADDRVVGYRPLAAHKAARERIPSRIGRSGPAELPAVLLARLAPAEDLRGRGLGAVLVADALARIVDVTRRVAARVVVVNAFAEPVARFCETLGFRRVPGSLLLVQKASDIAAALGER